MSFAIIRNVKYTRSNIAGIYRHNERINKSYSNLNIDHSKTKLNYAIKSCPTSYVKQFDKIRESKNLKGWIKSNSNIACEYIITSDNEFFNKIGPDETKRYFETAYSFVKSYKNLGDDFILSANIHLDEATPHMHLVFIPVVHTTDKDGTTVDKISCSEFWKGKNSYKSLQDSFYSYMIRSGFNLERGTNEENKHFSIEKLKKVTNYEKIQELKKENKYLKHYIDKTFDGVSIMFEFPKDTLKRVIDGYVKESNKSESNNKKSSRER